MRSYICEDCKGHCDAGELVGGKCPECREKERICMVLQDKRVRWMNGSFEQIELNFGGIKNGK